MMMRVQAVTLSVQFYTDNSNNKTRMEIRDVAGREERRSLAIDGTKWIVNRLRDEPEEMTLRILRKSDDGHKITNVTSIEDGRAEVWKAEGDVWVSPRSYEVSKEFRVRLETASSIERSTYIRIDDAGAGGGA